VKDQKHGPAIVRSVGGDGAVPRAAYGGARGPIRNLQRSETWSVDGHEPFVPLRRKALDLLEIQDRWIAFANDCHSLALFG